MSDPKETPTLREVDLLAVVRDRGSDPLARSCAITALRSRRDTERLDWLEANPDVLHPASAVSSGWNMEGFHDEEDGWGSEELNLWCRTLREAIDKATLAAASPTENTNGR